MFCVCMCTHLCERFGWSFRDKVSGSQAARRWETTGTCRRAWLLSIALLHLLDSSLTKKYFYSSLKTFRLYLGPLIYI